METPIAVNQVVRNGVVLVESPEICWYAAHTCANHEKQVAKQLACREVQCFLPTYCSSRRWKDRRVTLQAPLFAGYVFVRLDLRNRLTVLQVPGLARLVGVRGKPIALPDEEIERLKLGITAGVRVEPHPFVAVGSRVRVAGGPMAGLEGILVRRRKKARLVVSVELIMRSVAVEIDEWDLEPA